jgi:MATE family multidrug resistance protein
VKHRDFRDGREALPAGATAGPAGRATWIEEAQANLTLAIPIAIAFLSQMATVFVDNVMVGRLGAAELAAGGLGANMMISPMLLGMGILSGIAAVAAHAFGANDEAKVSTTIRQGLRLSAVVSLPCGGGILAFVLLLPHISYDEATVRMARGVLLWSLPGIPAFLAFTALRNFVTAAHRPRVVTVVTMLSIGVTALSNYLFVYGSLGMPRLGVPGIGLTGTIVSWLQFLAVAGYVHLDGGFRRFHVFARLGRHDPVIWEIVHIGWPISGAYLFENGLFLVTTMLVGLFGAAALAAHTVVIGLCSFTFMVPYSIGQAATVRVGRALGARENAEASWAGYVALHLGVIWMLVAATAFVTVPSQLVGLYIDIDAPMNLPTLAIALTLLPIAALFQVFDGTQAVAMGALRGLKDTRIPMGICFIGYWVIGLSAGALLGFAFGRGAVGLWLGLALGLAVTATLLTLRFHRQVKRLAP